MGVMYSQILPDGTLALIFAPKGYVSPCDPKPRNFVFMQISGDGNILKRIPFTSPSSRWNIHNIEIMNDQSLLFYGLASKEKNDKHYDKILTLDNYDNFQIMKINQSQVEYISNNIWLEFKNKVKQPAKQVKGIPYNGVNIEYGGFTELSNGDYLISGQEKNESKGYGNINVFHFDNKGLLKAQYYYQITEKNKFSTENPTLHFEIENTDQQTLTWIVLEIRDINNEGNALLCPRIGTIDLNKKEISAFKTIGIMPNNMFFANSKIPILITENKTKAIITGTDMKYKKLWCARINLTKP